MTIKEALDISRSAEIYEPEEAVQHIIENHLWKFDLANVLDELTELITTWRAHESELQAHYARDEAYEDEKALIEDDKFKELTDHSPRG